MSRKSWSWQHSHGSSCDPLWKKECRGGKVPQIPIDSHGSYWVSETCHEMSGWPCSACSACPACSALQVRLQLAFLMQSNAVRPRRILWLSRLLRKCKSQDFNHSINCKFHCMPSKGKIFLSVTFFVSRKRKYSCPHLSVVPPLTVNWMVVGVGTSCFFGWLSRLTTADPQTGRVLGDVCACHYLSFPSRANETHPKDQKTNKKI